MNSSKKIISMISMMAFLFAIGFSSTACGGKKKGMNVHSKSSMGNVKHKNKHVWGK